MIRDLDLTGQRAEIAETIAETIELLSRHPPDTDVAMSPAAWRAIGRFVPPRGFVPIGEAMDYLRERAGK